jgi:phosphate transport system protein
MPEYLEHQLDELKQKLLTMAAHAESAVSRALMAFQERDTELARQVIEQDRILDRIEIEVDDFAISLLAKAPLASDLRLITVGMKISHDLERVGDQATGIARRASEQAREPPIDPQIDIPRLAGLALRMLNDALESFVGRQPTRARAIIPRDKEVDALNRQANFKLVNWMIERPDTISRALRVMGVCKALERIADHATNIAEEIVYLYEGQDIRHSHSVLA